MARERTFAIIKPDVVATRNVGRVLTMIEARGFEIQEMKVMRMSSHQAIAFYGEHSGKPFFEDLVAFMSSGRSVLLILEREDAVAEFRKLIGRRGPRTRPKVRYAKLLVLRTLAR